MEKGGQKRRIRGEGKWRRDNEETGCPRWRKGREGEKRKRYLD